MIVYCPYCSGLVMLVNQYQYSWKDNEPTEYIMEFKCDQCGTRVRLSFPVSYYKVVGE